MKIKFISSDIKENLMVDSRKEALKIFRENHFSKNSNVVIELSNGERFNMNSARAKAYFGSK